VPPSGVQLLSSTGEVPFLKIYLYSATPPSVLAYRYFCSTRLPVDGPLSTVWF